MINPDEIDSFRDLVMRLRNPVAAQNYFNRIRWRDGVVCPYCDCVDTWEIDKRGKKAYRCGDCSNSFSGTVNTFFDNTKLPLRTWFAAIWLLWKNPDGVPSRVLAKKVNVTQPTAWQMMKRIRMAVRPRNKSFFDRPIRKEKADSSGVCRRSPIPNGLTFAEIIRRFCDCGPVRDIKPMRARIDIMRNLHLLSAPPSMAVKPQQPNRQTR